MDAFAHRALERGIRPIADAGVDIGRDIGAVDRAKRRLQRQAAGIPGAVGRGVADRAVAGRGHQAAAFDGRGGIEARLGGRNGRDRGSPWHHGGAQRGDGRAGRKQPIAFAPCRPVLRAFAGEGQAHAFAAERRLAQAHAGGVEDGVGDRGGGGQRRGGTAAQTRGRRQAADDADLGRQRANRRGQRGGGIGRNVPAVERRRRRGQSARRLRNIVFQRRRRGPPATGRRRWCGFAAVMAQRDSCHADFAAERIHLDVGDPRRPTLHRLLAIGVQHAGVGEAAPAANACRRVASSAAQRRGLPCGLQRDLPNQCRASLVLQMVQTQRDRIDAGQRGRFVQMRLAREDLRNGACQWIDGEGSGRVRRVR